MLEKAVFFAEYKNIAETGKSGMLFYLEIKKFQILLLVN